MMPLSRTVVAVLSSLGLIVSTANALVPPALVHTAIGAVAGSAGAIVAYPIDFTKSLLQTDEGRSKYSGGLQAAYDVLKNDGPLGLYRGAMVNVAGVAPEKTIKLSVNDVMREVIRAHFGGLPVIGEVVAGGVAGMTQVIVTNPLEVVKTRVQTSSLSGEPLSIKEALSQVEGLVDLYEGAEACVLRDALFSAILFPLYSHGKIIIASMLAASALGDAGGADTFWANMIAGTLAAAPAAFFSTPADVCKTRIQSAKKDRLGVPAMAMDYTATGTSDSFVGVAKSIIQQEGPEVLFSGWFERVIRSAPQFGVTLAMFDVLTSWAMEHQYLLPESGI